MLLIFLYLIKKHVCFVDIRSDFWIELIYKTLGLFTQVIIEILRALRDRLWSVVSDHARPRDPGGGTVPTVSPRRTIIDDVFQAVEHSGGTSVGSLPPVRQCGLKIFRLRTLLDASVLMMLLDYDRIRALCGCQMIECPWRTLSRLTI